jgi:hypothetical protein
MSEPFKIDPDALYDERILRDSLGFKAGSLFRARKSGDLKFTRKGGTIVYLGQWVLDWLTSDGAPAARRETACA